jgi:hypothetical protein
VKIAHSGNIETMLVSKTFGKNPGERLYRFLKSEYTKYRIKEALKKAVPLY